VLYTDVELEFDGASAPKIEEMDRVSVDPRRLYFIRRTTATLMELRSVIHLLDKNVAFAPLKAQMGKKEQDEWDEAVAFFTTNHEFLKSMRNDLGGHFQTDVSGHVLDSIKQDDTGVVEVYRRGSGADIKTKFAVEFVARALIKNREAGQTTELFLEEAFTFLVEATKHVVNITAALASVTLFA
jgi:hypothetical protein